jgi:class 3 adenylate cyclase
MALSILLIIYAHGEIKPTLTMIGLSIAPVLWGLLAAGEFQAETFGCFLIISGEIIAVGWVGVSVLRNNCMVSEKEMERLSLLAPAHIVRKMDNLTDLKQAFAPKSRPCVFISSDWRGYQELSGQLDMAQLATSLGYYYDLCEEVLEKYFPEGNYFTDWIADELFIVMFSSPSQSLNEVIRSSLQFCTELIERKQVFYQKHGFPEAIDIGVSSGEAYAGMLGPKSSPKATALGEVPGRSRRLQTVGKVLRQKFGETDRVIFGQEVFKELNPADYVVEELDVNQGDIRDVDDKKIYFVGSRSANLKVAS